ncbi:Cna B-type domain-containing protein, partial [Gemella morbillorum]|uniref:Cna B-type domain-containing protein n=1 Tax=Gemella morbillorum TaxID=29391 RepID=UPI00319E2204
MKKRLYKILLSLLVIIGTFLQVFDTKAIADGTKRNVSATITELRLENPIGTKATELNKNSSFYVAMDWKVDNPNEILNEGDYFDIDLPDSLRFPPGYAQEDFPLKDSNNDTIASAHLTRGPENVGGKIRVTFNNNIKSKYNVRGTLYLGALFNKTVTVDNQQNTFSVVVNGKQASTTVKVTKITKPADQVLTKWGARTTENGQTKNEVSWTVDVNYRQADLKNAVITDSLTGQGEYIPSSFKLQKVVYNDEGQITSYGDIVDLTNILTFDNGNKSFKIDLGDGGKSQYRLFYKTTYVAGTELKNKISISYVGETKEVSFKFKDQKAGGTAGGDLASKIKLIKVDEEDQNVFLQDAVFEVTGPDNQKFELRTGADGTIVSNVLRQGIYKVREIIAPQGYVLGGEEYTLEVTPAGGAIKKITNKKNKINISGTKTWNDNNDQDGKRPSKITVILKKTVDGQTSEVKRQDVTPDSEGEWKYEFTNLPLYENGKPITYSVDEVDVPGYTKETTATRTTNGPDYNLTNKHEPEKRAIEGQKIWNDNNNQDGKRPTSIKVKLYKKVGNGAKELKETKEVTEGADKAWKWKFENLDKYENKQEIQYTVEEEVTNGYAGVVTGSMAAGFKITNSYTPETVNISGEKTWEDNNNQDGKRPQSITVKLMKQIEGGQPEVKETKVVTKGQDDKWKYEFNNLPKYENGKLITYSIDEEKVAGYDKVTTRTTNGPDYNLTNKHEPETVNISGEKTWDDNNNQDGKRPESITVKLMKQIEGGQPEVKETKVVTKGQDDKWK